MAPLIEARYQAMEALVGRDAIDATYATLDRLLTVLTT
jgi:hypothetical protein